MSEALLAVEKLILEKKVDFIVGGPVRSEAALAAMPLLVKHKKISILTTGALTPKYNEVLAGDPEKFKVSIPDFGRSQVDGHGRAGALPRGMANSTAWTA